MSTHDALSDVLRSVRLRGAVFYYVSSGLEWAAEAPAAREIAAAVMPGAEHVMEYHVVAKGNGWAAVDGEQPVRLAAGDIVMFPHGDPHVMSSAPGLRPTPMGADWAIAHSADPLPIPVNYLGAERVTFDAPSPDAKTNLVCGFLGCDLRPFNPLIATLPRVLHLAAGDESDWIAQVMHRAVLASASARPGSHAVLERMSEMMFVDAIRRYMDLLPDGSSGWLQGLRDRHVGKALALLHADPAHAWTIDALARDVALSRSAFYDRFVQFTGLPPMQYLTQWRMQVASNLLRQTQAPVASVALDVGYESEAAFTRAFKRATGSPPATWRRMQERRPRGRLPA
jgi:AraC-like DNA-binding protein